MNTLIKILDLSVIAALSAFIPTIIYYLWQQRKKADASISLIREYAIQAEKNLEERSESYYTLMKQQIEKGNPYDEPEKNFSPLLLYNKEYELSFEQISDLLHYLSKKDQKILLEYFSAQSVVDSIEYEVNTDFFRCMPQKRKTALINILEVEIKKLSEKASKLVEALNEREKYNDKQGHPAR